MERNTYYNQEKINNKRELYLEEFYILKRYIHKVKIYTKEIIMDDGCM